MVWMILLLIGALVFIGTAIVGAGMRISTAVTVLAAAQTSLVELLSAMAQRQRDKSEF